MNRTRVNYYGKDFYTIVNELKDYIKSNYPEYSNLFNSDIGMMLVEVIAYGLDTMLFYLDENISENFLETAKNVKNIERIARQLGYKLNPANSAVSNVYIKFEQKYNFPIVFYSGYVFTGGGLEFIVDKDTKIIVDTDSKLNEVYSIPVREGRNYVEYFVSKGTRNQTFTLTKIPSNKFLSKHIENTSSEIQVFVNNEKWKYTDFIRYDDKKCFEVEYSNPPKIRFGGYEGQVPPEGSEIKVLYHVCSGKLGNLLENQINGKTPLIINNTNILFKIVGSDVCTNGVDLEDINNIKQNIPYYYRSRGLAITQSDFDYIIRNNIGVAKGKAISLRDLGNTLPFYNLLDEILYVNESIGRYLYDLNISKQERDVILRYTDIIRQNGFSILSNLEELISNDCKANIVEIYILSKDSNGNFVSPSSYLINNIRQQFENIVEPTVDVIVLDGMSYSYVVDIYIDLEVSFGYDNIYVSNLVKDAIKNYFLSLEFGQSVYLGDLYEKIESIDGVDHSNIIITNVWYNAKLNPNDRYSVKSKIVNGNVIINKNEFLILGNLIVNLV